VLAVGALQRLERHAEKAADLVLLDTCCLHQARRRRVANDAGLAAERIIDKVPEGALWIRRPALILDDVTGPRDVAVASGARPSKNSHEPLGRYSPTPG
jgi:hypothetical protein